MDFEYTDRTKELLERMNKFMDDVIYPAEAVYEQQMESAKDRWQLPPVMEECKAEAKKRGLWNMFLPKDRDSGDSHGTMGLSNLEYAPICEVLGRSNIASEATNCSAPDTGNMEVFARYASPDLKKKWLTPLLNGEIRSCFAMTEPAVASSDAKNIESRIESDGDHYVINGRKWWSSGMGDPRCKVIVFMGKSDPNAPAYRQQSMIIVPRDTPGIKIVKMLHVFGYDDAPHGHAEVIYDNVRVPKENMLLGEGPRLRDRAGPPRAGPHPSLHARHRRRRACPGDGDQAGQEPRRLRPARLGDGRHQGACRRHAHGDRHGPPAGAEGSVGDGQVRQQGSASADRHDQGRGAEHHLEGRRSLPAAARRRWCLAGLQARPACTRTSARCAWPTVRTKSIATRSAVWRSPSTLIGRIARRRKAALGRPSSFQASCSAASASGTVPITTDGSRGQKRSARVTSVTTAIRRRVMTGEDESDHQRRARRHTRAAMEEAEGDAGAAAIGAAGRDRQDAVTTAQCRASHGRPMPDRGGDEGNDRHEA